MSVQRRLSLEPLRPERPNQIKGGPYFLAQIQGAFYILTGLWPILSMRTFEKVTGPKQDDWLEKAVGLLIACSGMTLLKAGFNSRVTNEISLLGASQAFSLGSVSLFYSLKGQISKIYLLDASTEFCFVALWYFAKLTNSSRSYNNTIRINSFTHSV